MSQVLTIDEFALRDKARCGLSENQLSTGDWNVMPVLTDVLRSTAQGKWPDRLEVAALVGQQNRELLGDQFSRRYMHRTDVGTPKAFFVGVRLAQVAQEYWVLQPIEPYTLEIGGCKITGNYAVFQKLKRKERFVLYLRGAETEHQPVKPLKRFWPDLVSYARLVHFATTHPGQKVSVLNWHFSRELQWRDHINIDFARECLENAVRVVQQKLVFPSPGYHCRGCTQPECCFKSVRPPRKRKEPAQNSSQMEILQQLLAGRPRLNFFALPQEQAQ